MTLAHAQAPCIGTQHRISFRGDYGPMGRVGSCEARDRRPPSGRLRKKACFLVPEPKILTHERVLEILSEQAENGSVTAAAALERALRAVARQENPELDAELDRLLRTK
jgi:hypothetical protein